MICDERWKGAAAVSVNVISGASLGYAIRLKQPFALANFYPHYAFRFRRAEVVRRRPLIHKDPAFRGRPRLLPDAQCVITISANFWREPLVSDDGISIPFDQSGLSHERHKLWIILEVIDHCTNGVGGSVDRADGLKLLERRTRTRTAVDRDIVC